MPALFPNAVRIFSSKTDLVDTILAEHVNLLQEEVSSIESTLGTGLLTSSWSGGYSNPTTHLSLTARLANIESGLISRAAASSPSLTGTPTAPTAAADTNTTQLATTAFVLGQAGTSNPSPNGTVSPGTSPRYSRQDHVHPTDTSRASTADLATRAPLASPALTGVPTAPTAAPGTATTQLATTAFVDASFLGKANASVTSASVSQNVVRNITVSTSDPATGQGSEGDVWLKTVS